jgi:hypothetical protein
MAVMTPRCGTKAFKGGREGGLQGGGREGVKDGGG